MSSGSGTEGSGGGSVIGPSRASVSMDRAEADAGGGENGPPGHDGAASCPAPSPASIRRAYEAGQRETASDWIRRADKRAHADQLLRAACRHGDAGSVAYLLHEAAVRVASEASERNPAVLAARFGHGAVLKMLLDAIPGVRQRSELLNLLLSACCQRADVDSARLLVREYGADVNGDGAGRGDGFPVICALPLYAAARAGGEELADFLLENGAALSSYVLLDHPELSARLVARRLRRSAQDGQQAVGVHWGGLSLPWLELSWFLGVSRLITHLDLSRNNLSSLPSVLPWGLPRLQTLDLSRNRLTRMPPAATSREVICGRLREVNVQQNQLSALPAALLHLSELKKLCASQNRLSALFDVPPASHWMGLRQLEDLDVSDNLLSALPADITRALKSLRVLDVSRNRLGGFPDPWACPLSRCGASSNQMRGLPDNMSAFWKDHLRDVDLSDNLLERLPPDLFRLEALLSLRLCGNAIRTLPPASHWTCSQLRTLDLSGNLLGRSEDGPKSRKLPFLSTWSKRDPEPAPLVDLPALLRDSLEVLHLNDNRLERVPPSVCALRGLRELYLANNPGIRELPSELAGLSNLWQLDLENLDIGNVPQEIRREGAAAVLGFLRAQLRGAEPCHRLKMLLIGPPRQGKSSLLRALRTGKASAAPSAAGPARAVSTSAWEVDAVDAATGKSKVKLGVQRVGRGRAVGPVGRHAVLLHRRRPLRAGLEPDAGRGGRRRPADVAAQHRGPSAQVGGGGGGDPPGPDPGRVPHGAAGHAEGSRPGAVPLALGRPSQRLPRRHGGAPVRGVVQDAGGRARAEEPHPAGGALHEGHARRRQAAGQDDPRQLPAPAGGGGGREATASRRGTSSIPDRGSAGAPGGARRRQRHRALRRLAGRSRGLRTLYFLCPAWLAECLQRLLSLKSWRSPAANGLIRAQDLRTLLVGTGFTRDTEEQYFQLLAKFEIALPVANNSYLLPHLLPAKPGVDLHCFRRPGADTLQRLFRMSFVPAGFWERFIARMLISLTDMDLQSSGAKRGAGMRTSAASYRLGGGQERSRRSTFRVRRRQTVYWREGLLVTFDGGYLSVESTDVNWKKKKSGGIKIVCQSENRDFSAMAFVTDHINALIEQWFPVLTASESDGSPVLERYAPCPLCAARVQQNATRTPQLTADPGGGGQVHLFNVEDCALAAVAGESIACPRGPRHAVPLRELVPELFMTDFPARLFLEKKHLDYSEDGSGVIGRGGSGTVVYRARYRERPVAIKRFDFRKSRRDALRADADTTMKRLRSAEACRRFSDFRQEAAALHSLRHPCVVGLVGVSIRPLCLAMELAPLGSLDGVLEDGRGKGGGYAPLGHMVTYKMAYQVAAGLTYLHRKNVIFCDLKSDNILVWSLQERAAVNVKLSDYGICRQSFREGAVGVEGTPGYQAPEVRPGVVYDEKVDVFSYGMVLFELLSGRRPCAGRHVLDASKKILQGVRPQLAESPQEVNFHFLQQLMTQCWHAKPEKRPTALRCMRRMADPSFACLRYVLACGPSSQLLLPSVEGHHLLLWDGDADDRSYSVLNVRKGQLEVNRKLCPGGRVSCHVKVDDALWVATHEQEVLVYVLKDACPLTQPQKRFSCPAVVTCFLKMPRHAQRVGVLAGMSDGALARYDAEEAGLPAEGHAYLCLRALNKSAFGLTDSDPRQRPAPVTCMLLIGCGSQLWLSNGPGVLVVDAASLAPLRRLDPYECPSSVVSMATGFTVRGEESVWTLDDVTNTLVLFHAASFAPCAEYNCGDCSPFRDVFAVRRPSPFGPDAAASEAKDEEENAKPPDGAAVTIGDSEGAGTQIIRHRDRPTDGSASSSEDAEDGASPPSSEREDGEEPSADPAECSAPPCRQALRVLMVNDVLWVFRRGGDVLLIQVEPHGEQMRGRVSAVLSPPSGHCLGTLVEAGLAGKDAVACGFRGGSPTSSSPSSCFSVCVWRAWDAARLDVFYRSAEDLARLESAVRRRR